MDHLSKIFVQSCWQTLGKIVTTIATFIMLGIITRGYGLSGTGIFTLALSYLAIFYLLADFGFNAHVLKKLKTQNLNMKTEWQRLLGTRMLWSGALAVLAVGLLPFWPFASAEFSQAVIFGSLAIIAAGLFVTCNLIFQNYLRYDLSVLATVIGTLVGLVIFITLSSYKFPVPFLLFAHLAGWIFIAASALFLAGKILAGFEPIFDKKYIKSLFASAWPIAATLGLNVVYFRADSFMIAYFKGAADVGIYNVAYLVFQSALVVPAFIMNAYYPLMLKSLEAVKTVGIFLSGISFFGIFATMVFAAFIISVLAGSEFTASVVVLQILSLGFPAFFLSALLMWILITKGRYKAMLLICTSTLIFNLALNFIFIPWFSYLAAAWITVFSEYLILGLQVAILLRQSKKGGKA